MNELITKECEGCGEEIIDRADAKTLCWTCTGKRNDWRRAMVIAVLLILIGCVVQCRCMGGVVTEAFLDRVAWVESRNNPAAIGRNGEKGAWQMKPCAIKDVCNRYGFDARLFRTNQRAFARAYLVLTEVRISSRGRQSTVSEVRKAWCLGVAGSRMAKR